MPLALALAAVAAAVVLGGSTFAAFQAGSDRDIGGGPIVVTTHTTGSDTGTVGGGGPGGAGSTEGPHSPDPTDEPTGEPLGHATVTLAPHSPPPSEPGTELPSTGAPALLLLLTASLGLFLLALGAVGLRLTRTLG